MILDEPTRGVDVGAKSEVIKLVSDLADQGMSVILMTSEMSDLLSQNQELRRQITLRLLTL